MDLILGRIKAKTAIGVCCFSAKHTALIEGGYTITMAKRERIYNDPQKTKD